MEVISCMNILTNKHTRLTLIDYICMFKVDSKLTSHNCTTSVHKGLNLVST